LCRHRKEGTINPGAKYPGKNELQTMDGHRSETYIPSGFLFTIYASADTKSLKGREYPIWSWMGRLFMGHGSLTVFLTVFARSYHTMSERSGVLSKPGG
jgi:hypothetical protein